MFQFQQGESLMMMAGPIAYFKITGEVQILPPAYKCSIEYQSGQIQEVTLIAQDVLKILSQLRPHQHSISDSMKARIENSSPPLKYESVPRKKCEFCIIL